MSKLEEKEQELMAMGQQVAQEFENKKKEMNELETLFVKITGQLELIQELTGKDSQGMPTEEMPMEESIPMEQNSPSNAFDARNPR